MRKRKRSRKPTSSRERTSPEPKQRPEIFALRRRYSFSSPPWRERGTYLAGVSPSRGGATMMVQVVQTDIAFIITTIACFARCGFSLLANPEFRIFAARKARTRTSALSQCLDRIELFLVFAARIYFRVFKMTGTRKRSSSQASGLPLFGRKDTNLLPSGEQVLFLSAKK